MSTRVPSLGKKLDSAEAKIGRADQHLRALDQSLQRFRKRNPYPIGWEQPDSQVIVHEARRNVRVSVPPPGRLWLPPQVSITDVTDRPIFTLTLSKKLDPPVLRWGAMIGDIGNNVASALDNLISELVSLNPEPPQAPADAKSISRTAWKEARRRICFPYCDSPEEWQKAVTEQLFILEPSIRAVLEQAQPFYAWQHRREDPKHHPLGVLHKLWNRDKHHAVNITVIVLNFRDAQAWLLDVPDRAELPTETISTWPIGPIEGKTKVANIRVRLPQPVPIGSQVNMYVNANFTLRIFFGPGAPAEGDDAIRLLWDARNAAVDVINTFA